AKGLGFRERMELEQLPNRIEELEQEQQKLAEALADPANYQDKERVLALQAEAQRLAEQLQLAFERWEFLAAKEQERMGSASSG
ncbi:MAG: ABC transporter ATP-binding protein, partial [Acidithiobacillus sp.]|nr:ABC transporter ATP-binding protein [Acidithiobacillus sp.]